MGGRSLAGSPRPDFEFIKITRESLPARVIEIVVKSSSISDEELFKSLLDDQPPLSVRERNCP
jgi:hypothetical protein